MTKISPTAQIHWGDDGCLRSSAFDDVYSSKVGAIAESLYVFIEQNQLPKRWKALSEKDQPKPVQHFTIAETGFGTGLNFLLASQLWLELAPSNAKLVYISTEKYPLLPSDLIQAHSAWPELSKYAQALQKHYPVALNGMHTLDLFDGRIQLQLLIGDSTEQLQQQRLSLYPDLTQAHNQSVDAWFLDGFAPKKNPDMWSDALFETIYRLSKPGTTYATFTAAGIVRKGMAGAGFRNEKRKGFGRKRDMLAGHFVGLPRSYSLPLTPSERSHKQAALWYLDQRNNQSSSAKIEEAGAVRTVETVTSTENSVAIIGAGLAGCINAWILANDGYKVTLYDRHNQPAQEASGNSQGVLYSKLSHQNSPVSQFSLTSLLFSYRFYQELFEQGILTPDLDGQLCGTLQLAYDEEQKQLQNLLKDAFSGCDDLIAFLSAPEASEVAGIKLEHPALWIKKSGWINPATLCKKLIQHKNITFQQANIDRISHSETNNQLGEWTLTSADCDDKNQKFCAKHLIIANSYYAKQFNLINPLPVQQIKGQISSLKLDENNTSELAHLKTTINHAGYLAPAINNTLCFGATFELKAPSLAITEAGHDENIHKLAKHIPSLKNELIKGNIIGGRAAYRCASSDYLPLAGKLPIQNQFEEKYALMSKNRKAHIPLMGDYWPNLYLNIAHGSRGLTSAPLTGALIRAQINQMPTPVDREMEKCLNPARAVIRHLVRR